MTAIRDLISASISAADELENIYCDEGAALREACARAMVQPVSEVPAEYRGAKVGTEDGGEAYSAGYFDGRASAPQPVSAAEVPMPEVHDYGYHDADNGWIETLACDEADVLTYGDAREAAGYARGLAEAGTDAELLDFLDRNLSMKMGWSVGIAPAGNISVSSVIQLFQKDGPTSIRTAIDAALRGMIGAAQEPTR